MLRKKQTYEVSGSGLTIAGIQANDQREMCIVDMLAIGIANILHTIYTSPFKVTVIHTESEGSAEETWNHWGILVACDDWWSHTNPEKTNTVFCRISINEHGLFIGGPGNSVSKPDFPIEHPQMLESFITKVHYDIISMIENKVRKMKSVISLTRNVLYYNKIASSLKLIPLLDYRFLRYMHDSGFHKSKTKQEIASENGLRTYDYAEWCDAGLDWYDMNKIGILENVVKFVSRAVSNVLK